MKKLLIRYGRFAWILPVVVVFFAYVPAVLHLGYVWDDVAFNEHLMSIKSVLKLLVSPFLPGALYFRPLVILTFIAQHMAFGMRPDVTHMVSIGIHLCNIVFVFLLAETFFSSFGREQRRIRAFFAAILYGLHPALIESVAWQMGRFDLLATFFLLVGLLLYVRYSGYGSAWLIGLCTLAALFSKEEALIFPLLLFFIHVRRDVLELPVKPMIMNGEAARFLTPAVLLWMLMGLGVFLWLILRLHFIGYAVSIDVGNHDPLYLSTMKRMVLIGRTFELYGQLSLWPLGSFGLVHADITMYSGFLKWFHGIGDILMLTGLLVWLIYQRNLFSLILLLWLISLLPVLNILPVPMTAGFAQDRFMTFPAVFSSMLLCCVRRPLWLLRMSVQFRVLINRLSIFLLLLYCATLFVVVRATVPLWSNDLSLWTWGIREYPTDDTAQTNYVTICLHLHRNDLVADYFNKHPHIDSVYLSSIMASFELQQGHVDRALIIFHQIDPHLPLGISQLPAYFTAPTASAARLKDTHRMRLADLYSQIAQSYFIQKNYRRSAEFAEMAIYCVHDYKYAWLIRSFSAYGLGNWYVGDQSFRYAFQLERGTHATSLVAERDQFIKSICHQSKECLMHIPIKLNPPNRL